MKFQVVMTVGSDSSPKRVSTSVFAATAKEASEAATAAAKEHYENPREVQVWIAQNELFAADVRIMKL